MLLFWVCVFGFVMCCLPIWESKNGSSSVSDDNRDSIPYDPRFSKKDDS